VGLSGVGQKIREIIDKIRAKVDTAIIAIMTKLKALFISIAQGAKNVAGAILDWWKEKQPFKIGNKPHELSFQGQKSSAVLMVNSTPEPLAAVIVKLKAGAQTGSKKTAAAAIEAQVNIINQIKDVTGGGFGQNQGKQIKDALKIIADNLAVAGLAAVPPTKIKYRSRKVFGEEVGQSMEANPLSIDPGGNAGSEPAAAGSTLLWQRVNLRPNTYVQGHLLNHHLHGSGAEPRNLIPLARSANTTMETRGESKVKNAVLGQEGGKLGESVVVRYLVEMTGTQSARKYVQAESELPAMVTMQAWRLVADGNDWKDDTVLLPPTNVPNLLPADTPAGITRMQVDLSTSKRDDLQTIPGMGPVLADRIVKLRATFGGQFHTYDNLMGAGGIGDATVDALRDDPFVKLHG
jgi:hypothetical protein